MEHMKELLKSRIAEIQDPVQKILLQDVLVDVFGELLGYSEACFADLEKKLDEELPSPDDRYAVYTGVCKRDGVDHVSRSLFEIEKKIGNKTGEESETESGSGPGKVFQTGTESVSRYLGTLFMACDYPSVLKCMAQRRHARIETDMGDYQTTVELVFNSSYFRQFERLYRLFLANQKQWHTINCPFVYKLLDIIDWEGIVPIDAAIGRIEIELGEFSGCAVNDMVLVWNVSNESVKPQIEVTASGNRACYVHQIPLQDMDAGYLALAEGEDIFSTVFTKEGLAVRTQNEKYKNMELVKINKMAPEKDHTALWCPVQTNQRRIRHADRQAYGQKQYLWTRGEVERFLSAYEVFQDFELAEICMDMPGEIKAIDMNPFIRVHSFLKQKRKAALVFHPKDAADIFCYEKMFFLLAELQMCTQEYEWTGILR